MTGSMDSPQGTAAMVLLVIVAVAVMLTVVLPAMGQGHTNLEEAEPYPVGGEAPFTLPPAGVFLTVVAATGLSLVSLGLMLRLRESEVGEA